MRVDAEARKRELGHVGASDRHEAGRAHAGDRGGIAGRGRRLAQRDRAGRGHVAGHVEQVLHRNGHARIGRGSRVPPPELVEGVGRGARGLAIDLEEDPISFAGRILDPFDALVDERAARLSGIEPGGDLGQAAHGLFGLRLRPGVVGDSGMPCIRGHAQISSGFRLISSGFRFYPSILA